MIALRCTVNGERITATVPARLHLADFLREHRLLTGTHLGCEHGVCGACTLLLDGEPARACLTLAAICEGRSVTTIEGLEDDPIIAALRAAFTAEHALQCGYCTPGMLVTARDIVRRLPQADDARIRRELAGNLCRCTGYAGIVRAIARVLASPPPGAAPAAPAAPVAAGRFAVPEPGAAAPAAPLPAGPRLEQRIVLGLPRATVWAALQDPALIAGCLPGATLTETRPDRLSGSLDAALGPVRARFTGTARLAYDPAAWSGTLHGEAQDRGGGTRLSVRAEFAVAEEGPAQSAVTLSVAYHLRGPLAQLGRAPVVAAFAAETASLAAANLEARLRGTPPPPPRRLGAGRLLLRVVWRRLRRLLWRADASDPH